MTDFDNVLKEHFDKIMDAVSDDLLISDGQGRVMRVSPSFESFYQIKEEDVLGKTVYELEKEGVFRPSVIARVIEQRKRITMTQKDNRNRDIIVTATPVMDGGDIRFVVSFSRDITEMVELQERYSSLEKQIKRYTAELNELRKGKDEGETLIWESDAMERVMDIIERIADINVNVLLLGESGVGKTMLAKVIHQRSNRSQGPFVNINCAAIPENLLESELFGYEKGAFTGADARGKAGLMEMADGGTLLLDEISEMPLTLQAKLLKAIQEKAITKVGGTTSINVDFRLIAASNRDLEKCIEDGRFRRDLYYRLNVVNITIPPLAERRADVIPLMEYFISKFNEKYGLSKSFSPKAKEKLVKYSWPGNVRELSNVIERVMVTSEGDVVQTNDLSSELSGDQYADREELLMSGRTLNEILEDVEREVITDAYEKYHTTVAVAEHLGISQPTAFRKKEKYL